MPLYFGQKAVFNPRYLDFAAHYGFEPRACNVRKANEKGRVENAVGYVKKNLLAGLELPNSHRGFGQSIGALFQNLQIGHMWPIFV